MPYASTSGNNAHEAEHSLILGNSVPRLFPRPLVAPPPGGNAHGCPCGECGLTPAISYGYAVIDFARDTLRTPLDEWQQFLVIHGGELVRDGAMMRPRFKRLLIIVARQNGKTFLLKVLTLFWLFIEEWPVVLGQSTTVSLAREVWEATQEMAQATPLLVPEFGYVRRDNNDPHWKPATGSKYKIGAANSKGGRGQSVDRLIVDELREHKTWAAYNAAIPTMNARPLAQGWLITNQGDEASVVLVDLRATGVSNIEALAAGEDELDPELGLFEYSAKPGSDPTDPAALAAANPGMNRSEHGPTLRSLLGQARAAIERGGEALTGFKTEIMCLFVPALDAAVDPEGWKRGEVFGTLEGMRNRLALVPEISPDMLHASLLAAALLPDGQVRIEVIDSWSGPGCSKALRQALPGYTRKIRPRMLGWLPNGPTAAIAGDLAADEHTLVRKYGLHPKQVQEVRGEVTALCMNFAELVKTGDVLHCGQALLTNQVLGSAKLWIGDVWRFSRQGDGHCDAAYGAAAAVYIAQTMPPPPARMKLVTTQ